LKISDRASALVLYIFRLIRSVFNKEKKLSATALAVGKTAFHPELFDQAEKPFVFKGSWALRAFKPCIKPLR